MISAADAAVAGPTTQIEAAAADEVSVALSALFADHAESYQTLSRQAQAFQAQFVRALGAATAAPASP